MSCSDCIKGALHEGQPVGKVETIAGTSTYVSLPSGEYDAKVAVVFLTDIFGIYQNAQLLCDSFAANGFATYLPDYFRGDPIPLESLNSEAFDRDAWRARHPGSEIRGALDPVLKHLRESGVTKLGATGYCFGGRYLVELAQENLIEVGVAAHPSRVGVPEDLEKLLEVSKVPLLFNACEVDQTWPKDFQAKADEMMNDAYTPGWKQVYHPGCKHGFATRADLSVPAQKDGKEKAFNETVAWFRKHLE